MDSLKGKKVLVTGATGGIGQAIVSKFLQYGAIVAVSGTNKQKLENMLLKNEDQIFIFPCNLSDQNEAANLIDSVEVKIGTLDILICNAGITKDSLAIRMKISDFTEVINLNLTSSFILNKAAIKLMLKKKYGRIINISSVIASMGNPGQANYAASKAGMEGMTRALAKEVANRGITINCVAPGFIESPMTDKLSEQQKEKIKENIPSGELGKPEYIADAVMFLASDSANYITGQTLHVNGGLY